MSNTRRRRLHSDPRPARRSLVELTAEASRALQDSWAPTSVGLIGSDLDNWVRLFPTGRPERLREDHAPKRDPERQGSLSSGNGVPVALSNESPASECLAKPSASRAGESTHSDTAAEMIIKIAKDCHNGAFEHMKVSLNAALDYAKDLAEKRASEAAKDGGGAEPGSDFLTVLKGATAEFRSEALDLMKANAITTLEYARSLASTRTTADIIELSGTQARKQCELMLKQAGALKWFAQAITKSGAK